MAVEKPFFDRSSPNLVHRCIIIGRSQQAWVKLTGAHAARSAQVFDSSREAIFQPIFTRFGTQVHYHTELVTAHGYAQGQSLNGSREVILRPILTKFGPQVQYHTEITIGVDGMDFLYGLTNMLFLYAFTVQPTTKSLPGTRVFCCCCCCCYYYCSSSSLS